MAIFSNQATLTYNGNSTNSNVAYGEIVDVLAATKTAVGGAYTPGALVTYVVTLRNTGNTVLSDLTVTDDLGGYDFNGTTVYPLTYEEGSVTLFADGVPQVAPAVTAGPPLVITGIRVPADGDVVLVYQARANAYASPVAGGDHRQYGGGHWGRHQRPGYRIRDCDGKFWPNVDHFQIHHACAGGG